MKTIGILGGLSPQTTARLYLEIANAKEFKEYPPILISNVCFPKGVDKRIIKNEEDVSLMLTPLINSVNQLKKAGADFIVLPCNTLEDLSQKIISKTGVKLLTPVKETCEELNLSNTNKVGLIATSKTRELRLYEKKLPKINVSYPPLEDQLEISAIINRIISHEVKKGDKIFLKNLINQFKHDGCEKVILGCTDLSILVKENDFILDSFLVLLNKIKNILINKI